LNFLDHFALGNQSFVSKWQQHRNQNNKLQMTKLKAATQTMTKQTTATCQLPSKGFMFLKI